MHTNIHRNWSPQQSFLKRYAILSSIIYIVLEHRKDKYRHETFSKFLCFRIKKSALLSNFLLTFVHKCIHKYLLKNQTKHSYSVAF